tara:strand:+ start:92 stop:340 length:249 start_codon:yes stop_codon:yes gene_type:complete
MSSPAYIEQSLGKRGSVVITGATIGSFAIIVAGPSGATVSAITCTNKENATALITTLPAGYTSYGNFTAITVSAGSIEAYKA